jgi:hypothetical protein
MTIFRRKPDARFLVGLLLAALSMTAASAFRWTGMSGGIRVTISEKDVLAKDPGGKKVFSLRELYGPDIASDDPDVDTQSTLYRPLSLVGPYLSLDREASGFTPGAAHVWTQNEFVTLDLTEPKRPVALTRWFSEQQLLAALNSDPFLSERLKLPRKGVESLAALAGVFSRANDCRLSIGDGPIESFAFYSLEPEGKVAVRVGLVNSCIQEPMTQLGLLLPVPPSLTQDLKAAAERRHGFLMKGAGTLIGDTWISFPPAIGVRPNPKS